MSITRQEYQEYQKNRKKPVVESMGDLTRQIKKTKKAIRDAKEKVAQTGDTILELEKGLIEYGKLLSKFKLEDQK